MKTFSSMLPLGTEAPDFYLFDTVSQQKKSLHHLKSDVATVIMFICNHCPYVKHIQTKLIELANDYQKLGIKFIAINSNDTTHYPEDAPEKMQQVAKTLNYPFPYLFDESQSIAKAYHAACTPDFYVFDEHLKCIYRGCFDESTPGNQIPVTGNHLQKVLSAKINGDGIDTNQKPSVGCNIKWRE